MGATATTLDAGMPSRKVKKENAGMIPVTVLPSGGGRKKSVTIGRYQFRKDLAGWRCSEMLDRGAGGKRPYLGYLSRAVYNAMQAEAPSREALEIKLLDWAEKKREEKIQREPVPLTGGEMVQKAL
jgi:hypothetical protein